MEQGSYQDQLITVGHMSPSIKFLQRSLLLCSSDLGAQYIIWV